MGGWNMKVAILATIGLGVAGMSDYGVLGPQNPPMERAMLRPGRRQYDKPDPLDKNFVPEHEMHVEAACNMLSLETKVGVQLLDELTKQDLSCVNKLFGFKGFDHLTLKMVAEKAVEKSLAYKGQGSQELNAMFAYLRAGLNAHHHKLVTLDGDVHESVRRAVDAFVSNPHFFDNNSEHGKTMGEVILAIDSSNAHHEHLSTIKQWLHKWDAGYNSNWHMRNAVNHLFRVMYRGPLNSKYADAVQQDTELVAGLKKFVMHKWMLAPESMYLVNNAAKELGRLTMFKGSKIERDVNGALGMVFNTYEKVGYGDAVWLAAASVVDKYGDCRTHGTCGFQAHVMAGVLSNTYTCSSTIKILHQALTSTQCSDACSILGGEETYFHDTLQTGRVPIPGDQNTQLHVNVFHSYTDYQNYAPGLFGIDTNNGGMYLEGDPSDPNNVPNFVCHEASYAPNSAKIWNLRHEYVHYLDGRFDLYGGFGASTTSVVWWSEGVAEYMAYRDDNPTAKTEAMAGTYTLSTILDNDYSAGQTRIYYWGYLAVRFVCERHMSEVKQMISYTRQGDWSSYANVVAKFKGYDNEFATWLTGDLQTDTKSGGGYNPQPPPATPTPYNPNPNPNPPTNGGGCSSNCYGQTCDYYLSQSGYTCSYLNKYCDCGGCSKCAGGSYTPSTPAPRSGGGGGSCSNPHGCNSMSCDYYVTNYPSLYTCAILSSSYQCDCSGCAC